MNWLSATIEAILKQCVECGTRLDLKPYASCGWVCAGCARKHHYLAYQPSLR